jgi:hypothetical protein
VRHRWTLLVLAALALGLAGVGFSDVVAGEHVACTPAHTIADNGTELGVIPGECVTATDQTVTEPGATTTVHDTVTETVTTTVTAPPPPPPPPPPVSPTYDKTSDNGKTLFGNWPDSSTGDQLPGTFSLDGYQPQLVTDPAGSGRKVYALTTRDLPRYTGQGGNSQRADLSDWRNFQSFPIFTQGKEWWASYEAYFPSANVLSDSGVSLGHYVPMAGNWNWFVQFHNNNQVYVPGAVEIAMGVFTNSDRSNPRLFLDVKGGNADAPSTISFTRSPFVPMQYDHWYKIVFHFKFSHASDGLTELWVDGSKVMSLTAPNLFWHANTSVNDMLYPGEANYHSSSLQAGVHNTLNVVNLHRRWIVGPTAGSIGFSPDTGFTP